MNPQPKPTVPYAVVVPTVGRPSLRRLLDSLMTTGGRAPDQVVVVDDRRDPSSPLDLTGGPAPIRLLHTGGRGPAAARNAGWRAIPEGGWIAFLDDDVIVTPSWAYDLQSDLAGLPDLAAGSQGRIRVPLPPGRRPTDWERNVAGLARACWATADLAYRRDVLEEVGGFDEGFRRAFREDSDLGLRVTGAGYVILQGDREVVHPVRPADRAVSVRVQAGNADDQLMRSRHGPDWRLRAHAEPGRSGRHWAVTAALAAAAGAASTGRRGPAAVALAGWAAGTIEFAWGRIAPGPRRLDEIATMVATSCAIPPVACFHMIRGRLAAHQRDSSRPARNRPTEGAGARLALEFPTVRSRWRYGPVPRPVGTDIDWQPKAVLFDRDGTLMADRPYLGDPRRVTLMPGARVALARVREAGLAAGVVTNQSGVGRGLITRAEMEAVNRRLDDLLGGLDAWAVCCHTPQDGCDCRKPEPGLVRQAAERLGVSPSDCAVIGDIGADVGAARAAGARAVLVPTRATRPGEIRAAHQVAPDLLTAVDLVLGARC